MGRVKLEKRVLMPIRLYESDNKLFKEKVITDKISMQKVVEVLVKAYIKDDKRVMEIVKDYTNQKYARTDVTEFSDYEQEELLMKINTLSPLK